MRGDSSWLAVLAGLALLAGCGDTGSGSSEGSAAPRRTGEQASGSGSGGAAEGGGFGAGAAGPYGAGGSSAGGRGWGGGSGGDLIPDTGGVGGGLPRYDGPQYRGDQSCAPKVDRSASVQTCCEGVPCYGDCELHDGAWQCICGDVKGGCGAYGLVCCMSGDGCMAVGGCFGPID